MRKIVSAFLTVALFVGAVSCGQEEAFVSIGSSSFEADPNGGDYSVSFETNYDWSVICGDSWVHPSAFSGQGGTNALTVRIDANDSGAQRQGSIQILSNGISGTFTVVQGKKELQIVNKSSVQLDNASHAFEIETRLNVECEVKPADSWVKLVGTRALTTKIYSFVAEANSTYDARKTEIVFKDVKSSLTEKVEVVQCQTDGLLLSPKHVNMPSAGGNVNVQLQSNIDYEVIVPSAGWIHHIDSKGLVQSEESFSVDVNDGYDSRSAIVVFKGTTISDTLTVVQAQKDAVILSSREESVGADGATLKVEVASNVDYEVVIPSYVKWIEEVATKGLVSTDVFLNVAVNPDYENDREAYVLFVNTASGVCDTLHITQAFMPYMALEQDEVSVSSAGREVTVAVRANVGYSYSVPEDVTWVVPVQTKSVERSEVAFRVAPNLSYSSREAVIVFKSDDRRYTEEFLIRQAQNDAIILSEKCVNVPFGGDDITVAVSSNVPFKLVIPEGAEWIENVETRSLVSTDVNFKVHPNPSYDDRIAEIYFVNQSLGISDTLTVFQAFKPAVFLVDTESAVSSEGGIVSVKLKSNVDYEYSIAEGVDWIKAVSTKALVESTVEFEVAENTTFSVREADIVFFNADRSLSETFHIVQNHNAAVILSSEGEEVPAEGKTIRVGVQANVDYELVIPEDVDWISHSSTKGLVSSDVYLTVKPNDTSENREADVLFVNEEYGISEPFHITQGFITHMTLSQNGFSVSCAGGIIQLQVTANVGYSYEIPKTATWIKPVTTKGMVTDELTFSVDENEDYSGREADIVFRTDDGQVSQTLHVEQRQKNGLIVTVENTDFKMDENGGEFEVEVKNNVDFDVVIPSDCNWIRLVQTKGLVSSYRSFTVSKNTSTSERKAEIFFRGGGLEESITVTQEAKKFIELDCGNELQLSPAEQDVTVNVSSNVDFKFAFVGGSKWIYLKSSDKGKFVFHVSANETPVNREESFIFYNDEYKLEQTLKVVQTGEQYNVLKVIHNSSSFTLPSISGTSVRGTVDWGDGNNEPYSASASHIYSKSGSYTVTVELKGNEKLSFSTMPGITDINLSAF